MILTLFSVTISTGYADEINSVRLELGQQAPYSGTLYNEAADREINLALTENFEYEQALMKAVDDKNKYFFWAVGATGTAILLAIFR